VTYKWLARRFSVPFDTSKRILFEFLTRHPQVRGARQPCCRQLVLAASVAVEPPPLPPALAQQPTHSQH
jgi:hypothetical protein